MYTIPTQMNITSICCIPFKTIYTVIWSNCIANWSPYSGPSMMTSLFACIILSFMALDTFFGNSFFLVTTFVIGSSTVYINTGTILFKLNFSFEYHCANIYEINAFKYWTVKDCYVSFPSIWNYSMVSGVVYYWPRTHNAFCLCEISFLIQMNWQLTLELKSNHDHLNLQGIGSCGRYVWWVPYGEESPGLPHSSMAW